MISDVNRKETRIPEVCEFCTNSRKFIIVQTIISLSEVAITDF